MFNQFIPTYLQKSAEGLAVYFNQWRRTFPLLPYHIDDPKWTYTLLNNWIKEAKPEGIFDTEHQTFMIAQFAENPFFGKHAWIPLWGHALSNEPSFPAHAELYAQAGQLWLDQNYLDHYFTVPAFPEHVFQWQKLGFGLQQTFGLFDLQTDFPVYPLPQGFEIRKAVTNDKQKLADVSAWLTHRLQKAPVWAALPQQHLLDLRKSFTQLPDNKNIITWIICKGEDILGFAVYYALQSNPADPLSDRTWVELSVLGIHPLMRSQGLGRALVTHTLNAVRQMGFAVCKTDWRTGDSQSDQFWLKFGFLPVSYRIHRHISNDYLTTRKNAL